MASKKDQGAAQRQARIHASDRINVMDAAHDALERTSAREQLLLHRAVLAFADVTIVRRVR